MSPAISAQAQKLRLRTAQLVALGFILLIAAGIAAPFLRADVFRERIRASLEAALMRRVSLGEVHLNLFTGPGFQVDDVEISEDPALGAEPFAYVKTLNAVPRLWSLWTGHLEFASLRLAGAQVNLARNSAPGGGIRWNFEPLLRPGILAAFPSISLKSGRINFKVGNLKSVFYLLDAYLDISPPSTDTGDWQLRFRGEPARTDRPALGSGSFQARGRWRQAAQAPGKIDIELQLRKSEIGDIIRLINGEEMGLHGTVSGYARLAGPLEAIGIGGQLTVEDIHRWDQSPPKGEGWPLILSGRLNVPAQELEIDARVTGKGNPILSTHYRVTGYLAQPRWGVSLNCNQFPIEPILPLARHMGIALPANLRITGKLDGAVGYTGQGTMEGKMAFHEAAIAIPESPPVRFDQAEVLLHGGHAHLSPALAHTATNDVAQLEADYAFDTQALDLNISSASMSVASLRNQAALAAVPLLEQVKSGTWNGKLRYRVRPGAAALWTGQIELDSVQIPFAGFSKPIQLDSAQAEIDGPRVSLQKIRVHAGEIAAQGDYRYEPGEPRPHRFRLTIAEAEADALEKVLLPTLKRGNLLAMALRFGRAPVPDWMRDWHAEGSLQIGVLRAGDLAFERVRSRILWDSTRVTLPDIQARFEGGTAAARASIDLRSRFPLYRVSARLANVEWKGGEMDADAIIETSGAGRETLSNLRSHGSFTARNLDLWPPDKFRTVAGQYDFAWAARAPRIRFNDLQITTGDELFQGGGQTQSDGQLNLQLASGAKQLNLTGSLASGESLHAVP